MTQQVISGMSGSGNVNSAQLKPDMHPRSKKVRKPNKKRKVILNPKIP